MENEATQDSGSPSEGPDEKDAAQWTELRRLLLGDERSRLAAVEQKLTDPAARAAELSLVLPRALRLRPEQDPEFSEALRSPIEQAIQRSVQKDSSVLAEAIFPVIGPALRQAINAALRGMVLSLNQMIEQSVSPRGWRWRVEAWRTGRPYAEVALLRSLTYRVEHVFLINRRTGLLLEHVSSVIGGVQDTDTVSGMLTAIQDFVHDSFDLSKGESIEALQVGELSIVVEQGPQALLAAVVRGSPPPSLRRSMQVALESLHGRDLELLSKPSGDETAALALRPSLERCLLFNQATSGSTSPLLPGIAAVALIGAVAWGFLALQKERLLARCLDRLSSEPGIVVVSTQQAPGGRLVLALRDPLARDPAALVKTCPNGIRFSFQPFLSLSPELVLVRARAVLRPPETVDLQFADGVLRAAGKAGHTWIRDLNRLALSVGGVRELGRDGLVDLDRQTLEQRSLALRGLTISFPPGVSQVEPSQQSALGQAARDLLALSASARALGQVVEVHLLGRADWPGPKQKNLALSQARAAAVLVEFGARGLPRSLFIEKGLGASSEGAGPQGEPGSGERSVRLEVSVHPGLY